MDTPGKPNDVSFNVVNDDKLRRFAETSNMDFLSLRNDWLTYCKKIRDDRFEAGLTFSRKYRAKLKDRWINNVSGKHNATKKTMSFPTFVQRTTGDLRHTYSKLTSIVACVVSVHGLGFGVESTTKICTNVLVAEYMGARLSYEQAKKLPVEKQSHMTNIAGTGMVIDGIKDPSILASFKENGYASFVNHAKDNNCILCVVEGLNRVFLVTSRDVAAGEALTINYGADCFASIHVRNVSTPDISYPQPPDRRSSKRIREKN
jgi:hypothetical protein